MLLGTEVGLGLGHIVLVGEPVPPKGTKLPSNFPPMSIVAKPSPISATAKHLLSFCPLYALEIIDTGTPLIGLG